MIEVNRMKRIDIIEDLGKGIKIEELQKKGEENNERNIPQQNEQDRK
jgi:hypothetical protein